MTTLARFEQLAQHYFEFGHQADPIQATVLGIHRYDDRLGDFRREHFEERLRRLREFEARFAGLDPGSLPDAAQVDYALVVADIRTKIQWIDELGEWRRNPIYYVEWPLYGLLMLVIRDFAPLPVRLRSLIGRLSELGSALEAARANLDNPPRVYTEIAIESLESGLDFFDTLVPAVAKQAPELEAEVLAAAGGAVAACTNFLHFLKTNLLPRSRGNYAIGKEKFEAKLRTEHMLDLTTEQLFEIGRRTFDETKATIVRLARQIDRHRPWHELIEEARHAHPSANQLLDAYRTEVARLREFLMEREVVTFPSNEVLEITETPGFARATTPYAAYLQPAPFEAQQTGQFWVTPVDGDRSAAERELLLREHCHAALPITALHETYPGHHLQLVWSNRVSNFIRKHVTSDLFAEGWALYCEQLMGELGYVPASGTVDARTFRLFLLKDQLWRAARVLIDVGLHTNAMGIEEATRLLVDEVRLTEPAARVEVRRYTMTPTQPLSYMLGKLELLRLRDELGLPLRRFHDLLLSAGTIPPKLVRRDIERKLRRR